MKEYIFQKLLVSGELKDKEAVIPTSLPFGLS